MWNSESRQENSHWESVQFLAAWVGNTEPDASTVLFGGEPIIHLTTVSTNGDYRYQSWTTYESFVEIEARRMGLDEWKELSDAGFR